MTCGAGMVWLRSVSVCFFALFVSSPNESDGTVGLECAKRER